MILHDINSTNPYLLVGILFTVNVIVNISAVYFLFKYRNKIKWKEKKFDFLFFGLLYFGFVPFQSYMASSNMLVILGNYEDGFFTNYEGLIYKIEGNTTGIYLNLKNDKKIFAYSRMGCFTDFNKYDYVNSKFKIKYVPYIKEGEDTAYCVVHVEKINYKESHPKKDN